MNLSNPKLLRFKSLFLSLLVLFGLVAVILFFNYYATLKVERNANIIDGAGEMSDQFYNLALDIHQLKDTDPAQRQSLVTRTQEAQAEIDTLLGLLETGGVYDYGDGDYLDIDALKEPASQAALQQVQKKWQRYQDQLNSVLNDKAIYSNDADVNHRLMLLSDFAFNEQDNIYDSIDEIYADRFNDTQFWNNVGKFVLIGGIGLVSLYFLWFVLFFMRRLIKSEEHLQKSREQNQEILSTINEGLFLIDHDLIIAEQYSDQLEIIVNQKNIAGKSLLDIVAPLVSDKDLIVIKSFVKQLYSSWVVEELIEELNPLKNIKVVIPQDQGGVVTRYLDFSFSRVLEDDEIIRILVTVADITEATELNERLAQEQQQNDRQIEMISSLIEINGAMLQEFTETTAQRLEQINEVLKTPGSDQEQMRSKAQSIFRHIHSIKGEASALRLLPFVDLTQSFESKISTLTQSHDMTGNSFIPLAVMLEELINLLDFVDGLAKRLHLYGSNGDGESSIKTLTTAATPPILSHDQEHSDQRGMTTKSEPQASSKSGLEPAESRVQQNNETTAASVGLTEKWQQFAQAIAARQQKAVELKLSGFEAPMLAQVSQPNQSVINDIVVQLLRNAIVHGIEKPIVREQIGKSAAGNIAITLAMSGLYELELTFEDDGRGIDFDKIQQKAIEASLVDAQADLSKSELIELMFSQGVSTAQDVDQDAGHGVGMDIIKALVKEQGGGLSINTKPNQFTQFVIKLPNHVDPQTH